MKSSDFHAVNPSLLHYHFRKVRALSNLRRPFCGSSASFLEHPLFEWKYLKRAKLDTLGPFVNSRISCQRIVSARCISCNFTADSANFSFYVLICIGASYSFYFRLSSDRVFLASTCAGGPDMSSSSSFLPPPLACKARGLLPGGYTA